MQCKDISTERILRFLAQNPNYWHNNFFEDEYDVHRAMPAGIPQKLVVAKMASLIKRGLVDGCGCGCRGDYHITEKGLKFLKDSPVSDTGEFLPPNEAAVRQRIIIDQRYEALKAAVNAGTARRAYE